MDEAGRLAAVPSLVSRAYGAAVWRVGLVVLAVHLAWIGAFFGAGHEIRDFIKIGPLYVIGSDESDVIRYDPTYSYPPNRDADTPGEGYDGQSSYYIALDPAEAPHYLDNPPYRYGRILYPITARVLAAGQAEAIPYSLLAINVLAIVGATLALAAWLSRRDISPWFALVYGLFPGLLLALQRDLTEPLAYALVAVGVYLFDFGRRRGVLLAAGAFGLAALARETTLIFPALFAASILAGRPNAAGAAPDRATRRRRAGIFAALALAPAVVYGAFVWAWLGAPVAGEDTVSAIPFAGLLEGPWELARQPPVLLFVALPALLCAAVALRGLGAREGMLERACLLANVVVAVLLIGPAVWATYTSAGRVSAGVVLSALLCLPYLLGASMATRRVLAVACGLWLVVFPVVLAYGFLDTRI